MPIVPKCGLAQILATFEINNNVSPSTSVAHLVPAKKKEHTPIEYHTIAQSIEKNKLKYFTTHCINKKYIPIKRTAACDILLL